MSILYDLIFLVVAIICLPRYLFRRKFHRGFLRRLGFLPKDLKLDRPIWIHAVSVGEVIAVRGLLEQLRVNYPAKLFVISTVTPTGNKIARGLAQSGDFITYLPLDFSFIVKNVIERINPEIFIIVETELWPNLVGYLYRKQIPVVLVNGRISDVSFKGYLAIKFLLRPFLNKISLFCVQTSLDGERFFALGVPQNKIRVSGNMKFDSTNYTDLKKDYTDYRQKLGLGLQDRLMVAGSTHAGEEVAILNIYKELLAEFPNLRLLIAPRHPERAFEIVSLIKNFGFESIIRISSLNLITQSNLKNPRTVFILDTIGQLLSFYSLADIIFVGGSLIRKGGHNILEPASLSKPILFGPHMFNFRDIAQLFLRNNAAILVRNKEELKEKIKYLLGNRGAMDELGKRAKALILENQGATLRNTKIIKNLYEGYEKIFLHRLAQMKSSQIGTDSDDKNLRPSVDSRAFQKYFYNLTTDRYKGPIAELVKCFLLVLSFIYGLAVRTLIFWYGIKPYRLDCKVISVGNITLGGTGKTSLVEYIAQYLKQQGHKVAILSRGYRKKSKVNYESMGDEPYMLSKKLVDIAVIVDADRIRGAKRAISDYGADTVILDDGFQQWKIKKDLDIVTIDATNPLGNRKLLPRGILREPLSSLKRADAIVLTKTNLMPNVVKQEVSPRHAAATPQKSTPFGNPDIVDIEDFLREINLGALLVESLHWPVSFSTLGENQQIFNIEALKGKRVILVSGIGDPDSFESLITSLGINIAQSFRFPDHHNYTQEDLERVFRVCLEKNIDTVITTEKDAARIQNLQLTTYHLRLLVLCIELKITKNEQRFHYRLQRIYSA